MNKRNFIISALTLVSAKLLAPFKSFAADGGKQDPTWSSINIANVNDQRIQRGGPYLSFINRETLKTGLYVLPKGAEDKQNPHELDEVYYILEGKSKFVVDGSTIDVKPGDVIYVKAAIEHRFIDIESDLQVLVFFSEKK